LFPSIDCVENIVLFEVHESLGRCESVLRPRFRGRERLATMKEKYEAG
jgi:hypothetical protein